MQLSPYRLLLLTQPLHSSEQHIRANLEFSSNFDGFMSNLIKKSWTDSTTHMKLACYAVLVHSRTVNLCSGLTAM